MIRIALIVSVWFASLLSATSSTRGAPEQQPTEPPIVVEPALTPLPRGNASRAKIFIEAWTLVRDNFYDPAMHSVDWDAVRDELLPAAEAAASAEALSVVINDALGRLRASHMGHYSRNRREYYELLDIFGRRAPNTASWQVPHDKSYSGIGLVTTEIDGKTFVADAYDAGPAAKVGIHVGDELISVDGQAWSDIAPFREEPERPRIIVLQRGPDPYSTLEVSVRPERIKPHAMFLESMRASARMIESSSFSIGYVRVRSYADSAYHELLRELLTGALCDADGLIVDFRGGWGRRESVIFGHFQSRRCDDGASASRRRLANHRGFLAEAAGRFD